MSKCKRFASPYCGDSYNCPAAIFEKTADAFGPEVTAYLGLRETSCSECQYNTGKCKDCLFMEEGECTYEQE